MRKVHERPILNTYPGIRCGIPAFVRPVADTQGNAKMNYSNMTDSEIMVFNNVTRNFTPTGNETLDNLTGQIPGLGGK